MTNEEIMQIMEETGTIRHGHFVLTSGRHSDTYMQCARLMESPTTTLKIAKEAVSRIPQDVRDSINLVASPAVGGITFGFAVGLALNRNFIFSERKDGKMSFRRSFEVPKGANVLVCEDVVTTGGSVKELCDLIQDAGGNVAGVISIFDRQTDRVFNAPFWPLISMHVDSWEAEKCVLCTEGGQPESLGSRTLAK